MQTMTQMTFSEAVSILDEFVDRFVWLATPAHGSLPDKAGEAISFLQKLAEPHARFGMWTNEELNQRVYSLTRQALEDPQEVDRVMYQFEDIVQTGYGLPVQKVFLLWESGRISIERLIIFFEDSYKWASELPGEVADDLRDEVVRWTFHLLWKVTQRTR